MAHQTTTESRTVAEDHMDKDNQRQRNTPGRLTPVHGRPCASRCRHRELARVFDVSAKQHTAVAAQRRSWR